jgi:hypothetical protein
VPTGREALPCVHGRHAKILAVDDLKKEEVRRGHSEHARSDDCHGFEYAAAYKLKSAVHAEILTLVNAEEDPIEEVD